MRGFIQEKLQNGKIILSYPILHSDLDKYLKLIEEANKQLRELSMEVIRNDIIKREHPTQKVLQLNIYGIKVFAMNLIEGVRNLRISFMSPYQRNNSP